MPRQKRKKKTKSVVWQRYSSSSRKAETDAKRLLKKDYPSFKIKSVKATRNKKLQSFTNLRPYDIKAKLIRT